METMVGFWKEHPAARLMVTQESPRPTVNRLAPQDG